MKKVFFILAIVMIASIVPSCTSTTTTDAPVVKADSTKVDTAKVVVATETVVPTVSVVATATVVPVNK